MQNDLADILNRDRLDIQQLQYAQVGSDNTFFAFRDDNWAGSETFITKQQYKYDTFTMGLSKLAQSHYFNAQNDFAKGVLAGLFAGSGDLRCSGGASSGTWTSPYLPYNNNDFNTSGSPYSTWKSVNWVQAGSGTVTASIVSTSGGVLIGSIAQGVDIGGLSGVSRQNIRLQLSLVSFSGGDMAGASFSGSFDDAGGDIGTPSITTAGILIVTNVEVRYIPDLLGRRSGAQTVI